MVALVSGITPPPETRPVEACGRPAESFCEVLPLGGFEAMKAISDPIVLALPEDDNGGKRTLSAARVVYSLMTLGDTATRG